MNRYRLSFLVSSILASLLSQQHCLASLVLAIDLSSQELDWVDGTGITKTAGYADNRFGASNDVDAFISSPLPDYSGIGTHYGVAFDISADGSLIEGIGLFTTWPPGIPVDFSGTPEGPMNAVFSTGDFSAFAGLSLGMTHLPPVSEWSGGITVNVIPEPAAVFILGLGGMAILRKRKRPAVTI